MYVSIHMRREAIANFNQDPSFVACMLIGGTARISRMKRTLSRFTICLASYPKSCAYM